jgi:hypothetical protein
VGWVGGGGCGCHHAGTRAGQRHVESVSGWRAEGGGRLLWAAVACKVAVGELFRAEGLAWTGVAVAVAVASNTALNQSTNLPTYQPLLRTLCLVQTRHSASPNITHFGQSGPGQDDEHFRKFLNTRITRGS